MTVISVFALAAAALLLTIAPPPGRSAIRQRFQRTQARMAPGAIPIPATRTIPLAAPVAWQHAPIASTTRDSTKAMP